MAQEAAVPLSTVKELARQIAREEVGRFARSGFLRNASISGGAGLRIIDGGKLALIAENGTVLFYIGPVSPSLPDGSPQPGWEVRRADGTLAFGMRDAFPDADGTLNQALTWYDRAGNAVIADDTDSGQGIARPWLTGGFYRARYADMGVSTTSSTFETLWEARLDKQQPQLIVGYKATMDTTETAGETRVLVNDAPLGPVTAESFAIVTRMVGPAPVAGAHMDTLTVKIQGRRTSATGALRVEPAGWWGRQT